MMGLEVGVAVEKVLGDALHEVRNQHRQRVKDHETAHSRADTQHKQTWDMMAATRTSSLFMQLMCACSFVCVPAWMHVSQCVCGCMCVCVCVCMFCATHSAYDSDLPTKYSPPLASCRNTHTHTHTHTHTRTHTHTHTHTHTWQCLPGSKHVNTACAGRKHLRQSYVKVTHA